MTCENARTRIQDRIDGPLEGVAARDLDEHLAQCAECRGLAADLAAIAGAAGALPPIDVPDRVWLQVAGRWRAELPAPGGAVAASPRRKQLWLHGLAAAAMLAVAAGGGWIAWRATSVMPEQGPTQVLLPKPDATQAGNADGAALVETAQKDLEAAEQLYTRAIAGLEQAALASRESLEPHVVATLDRNLEVIDEAIGESRAAVQREPQSVVARESLFDALKKKVTLLQDTIAIVSDISSGNPAGVTRLSGT